MGGTVDYPAEIRPQRMPGLPHATTKQTLNRGRFAGQSHDPFSLSLSLSLFYFVFSRSHIERTTGRYLFFFCFATSTASILPLPFFLFYRLLVDMLPRGITDRFVPKSGNILADFSRY